MASSARPPAADAASGVSSEILAHTDTMRFTLYALAPGAEIPWHFHSEVSDWYIARDGAVTVETRSPDERVTLRCGEMHNVPARRIHRVSNAGANPCRFALVQETGRYDFNPIKT